MCGSCELSGRGPDIVVSLMVNRLNGHKGHLHLVVWPLRLDSLSRRASWAWSLSEQVSKSLRRVVVIDSVQRGMGYAQRRGLREDDVPLGF